MSVLISMFIGSKLSEKALVEKSILSILSNIGTENFLSVVGISPDIKPEIIKFVEETACKFQGNLLVVKDCLLSAPGFHNQVFQKYGTHTDWFIVAHDDIELKTPNLISELETEVKDTKDIGWVSFNDDDYLNGNWAPSVRAGFHYDFMYERAWQRKKMWQYHLLEEDYREITKDFSSLNYVFPIAPVKCHAPFCHFIAIQSEKFRQIGPWENWSLVSLLADEDQGLRAMQAGLVNIWVPSITYTHIRGSRRYGTRSWTHIVKERKQVHEAFKKKWGFDSPPSVEELKNMDQKLTWSVGKRSYEWDYLT